ncbi:MAG: alpha/beta fold hydrolase [Lentisphaeria bacterium]|nr:alpha/beta fold hydrolase [Lentisphaeria bacterium]
MLINDIEKLYNVPEFEAVELFHYPGIKQFFYNSVPYQGKSTRVFACCGFPENASADNPVPGVVLIHGGGATALADWVEFWNQLGFAAISMDTCGCVPCWSKSPYYNEHWPRHKDGGPAGWGKIDQAMEPAEDQWCYHALCAAILGHSLLRSFPQVDPGKIGVHGISWGGVLTLLAAAHDKRFGFALPVYGTGYFMTKESKITNNYPQAANAMFKRWQELFDPANYLDKITAPCLFFSGTNDYAFPFNTFWQSVGKCSGEVRHLLYPDYPHNHKISWTEKTVEIFAKKAVSGELLPATGCTERQKDHLTAALPAGAVSAQFCYTTGSGFWSGRLWRTLPAAITSDKISAVIPLNMTVGYFNITFSDGTVLSTRPYFENPEDMIVKTI